MRSAARVVVVGALVLVTGVGSRAFAAEAASEPTMLHKFRFAKFIQKRQGSQGEGRTQGTPGLPGGEV